MTYNQKNYIIDYNNITNKPFLSLDERKLRVINGQLTTVFINSNFTEGSNIEINIDGAISVPDNIFRQKIQEFGSGTADSYFEELNPNEIYVLSNVGIGLSDPQSSLHIYNNTNRTSFIIDSSYNDFIELRDTLQITNDIFINFNNKAKIGLVNYDDIVFKKVSNSSNLKITDDFVEISDETYLKLNKGYVNNTLYLGREIGYDNSETNVKLDLFNFNDTSLKLSSYFSDVNDSNEYYIKTIKNSTESYFAISSGDINVFTIKDNNITAEYDLDVLGTTITEQLNISKNKIIQIACGRFYTMVLTDLGEVWGWGDNGQYQVSSSDTVPMTTPTKILETDYSPQISIDDKIIQIACGSFHTMFLTDLGKVYGCGDNSGRQINSTGNTIITPTEVTVLPTSSTDKIIQISCGAYYTMFLTESGKVYGCGKNDYYQVNSTKDVDGDTELDYIKDPKEITNFSPEISHPDKIIQIACGNEHTIFLTNSGKVYGCGRNDYYQVDSVRTEVNTRFVKITPTEITDLPTDKIIQIACGWYHTMFLTDLGEVYGKGQNDNKQINSDLSPVIYSYKILKSDFILSDGTSSPPLGNITQIACGSYHTMFLTDIGEVYGRGYNYYKQILLNSDTNNNIYSPTKITDYSPPISTQDKIIQIACGMSHTMFLTETDQVWGCGKNNVHQVSETITIDDKIQTPERIKLKFVNKGIIGIEESDTGDYYFRIYTTTDTNISLSTKVDTHTLVISSNDNVGINKTNPDSNYKLDVGGNLNIDGIATISSNLTITSNLTVGSNIYFSGDLYKNGNLYTSYTDEDTKILLNTGIGKSNIVFENARIKEEEGHLIINTNINYSNIILKDDKVFLNYDKDSISSITNNNTLEVNGDINLAEGRKFKINNEDISLFSSQTSDINYKGPLYYGYNNVNTNDLMTYNLGDIINFIDGGNGIGISENEILQLGISDNNSIKFDNSNIIISSNLTVGSNIYFSGDLYKNGNLYTSYTDEDTSNYLLNNLDTSIIPKDSLTYDLGSVENKFKDLYIGPNSIWFGDSHKISVSGDKIKIKKLKTDAVPQGLVTKLSSMSEDDIKQDIIATMGQSGYSEFYAGGKNNSGQLGLGDQSSRTLLNKIKFFNNVDRIISNTTNNISCSDDHTLFLDNGGKVYSCGYNYEGRLGLGDFTSRSIPALIQYDNTNNNMPFITKISAGSVHSFILDYSGQVYSFGTNYNGQLGLGLGNIDKNRPTLINYFINNYINIKDIAAGNEHSLFLDNEGKVYSCGRNNYGQLGIGNTTDKNLPNLIQYKNDDTPMPEITKIKCGSYISLFLDVDGNVYSCGRNIEGQLGIDDNINKNKPKKIQQYQYQDGVLLSKPTIIDMSAGEYHILLLDEDGNVYSCGTDRGGVLGFDTVSFTTTVMLDGNNFKSINKPTLITNFINAQNTLINPTPKISKISSGYFHSLFLDVDGRAYSCGVDLLGQLCHDIHDNIITFYSENFNYTHTPTLITKIKNDDNIESDIPNNIIDITASYYSTFITTTEEISLSDLSLKDWLDYGKSKDTTITNINDIFTDEDADDENLDIWLTNNSDIYLNSSNYNRLGIGITNPEETLHVEGNAIISSNLTITSNLTVGSNIYFSGDLYQNGNLYTSYTDSDTSNYLLNNLDTSIIPSSVDSEYNLGSSTNRFSNLYLDGNLLIGDIDVISQLSANSNFLKEIINSSNELQNEKLHNTSNLLHSTSNFLKEIINSSNQIQNEKLHNTSNLLHSTSNFLKEIINSSNQIQNEKLHNTSNLLHSTSNFLKEIINSSNQIQNEKLHNTSNLLHSTSNFLKEIINSSNQIQNEKLHNTSNLLYSTSNFLKEIINSSNQIQNEKLHNTSNLLYSTSNFLKEIINSSNQIQNEKLHNTSNLLYSTSNFLKEIINSSNQIQNEKLHNTSNLLHSTSNFLKEIINSSNQIQNEKLHNTSNLLYSTSNFLKEIINSSNELQNEKLHNTSNLLHSTSNFLKEIINSSNELQNEKLHNTSNLLHSTSNFLKEIIHQSNIDLTNLIENCNQNVSNYINRLDVLTSNITRDVDNSYIIDTDLFIDGTLKASNLEVIGQTTIIETDTYKTENLLIDNTDADGPSLKIKHSISSTNNILDFGTINEYNTNYQSKLTLDNTGLLKLYGGLEISGDNRVLNTCNIIPKVTEKFSLGTETNRFNNLYLNGNLLIGEVDVISQLDANSNFLKAIINSSNQIQNEKLHNTSNFLKAIIYSSNQIQNENLHNTSNLLHSTSNFLKAIIDQSNIDLTNLIEGCNENVSNYINRIDVLTSNIEVLSDNSYKISTDITLDGLLRISNTTSNKVELLTTNGIWNIDVLDYQTSNYTIERKYPPIDLSANNSIITEQDYGDGNYVVDSSSSGSAAYNAFKDYVNMSFDLGNYNNSTGYYQRSDYIKSDYLGDYLQIKLPQMIKLTKYKFKQVINLDSGPLSDYKIYGSNDGSNWVELFHRTSTFSYINGVFEENVYTTERYYYFALVVRRINNYEYSNPFNKLWFDKFEIYGKELLDITDYNTLTITNENNKGLQIYKNGFFGFNNNTPENTIDVNGNINTSNIEDKTALIINQTVEQPIIDIKKNDQSVLFINESRYIGINNNIPSKTLDITGDARISSNLTITSNLIVGSNIYFSGDLYQDGNLYTSYTDSDTSNYLLNNLDTSIIPNTNDACDLGNNSFRFKDIYINHNIYLNDNSEIHPGTDGEGILKIEGELHIKSDMVAHYSDERLKNKLEDIRNVLNKIKDLNVIKYNNSSIADNYGFENKKQIGLIAQEIIKIYPEIVTLAPFDTIKKDGNKESKSGENYLTLKYERLVPILLQAIKELNEKNNLLEEKYEKLSIDIEKIKKYLNIID